MPVRLGDLPALLPTSLCLPCVLCSRKRRNCGHNSPIWASESSVVSRWSRFPSCKTSEIKTAWVPSAVRARSAPVTSRPRVDSVGERASTQLCHLGTCPPAPVSWLRQDDLLSGKHPHSSLGVCGLCETTFPASGGHVATCWLEHRCWFKTTGLLGARR